MCLICLVSLQLLAMQIADLLSKTIKGASLVLIPIHQFDCTEPQGQSRGAPSSTPPPNPHQSQVQPTE